MQQNAYLVAKIGADTAENEQHFAEILPKIGNYPPGPLRLALRAGVVRLADERPHAGGHQTAGLAKGDIAGLYMGLYF